MSNLSSIEMIKLEKLLGMASGYVLDFSNVTFCEFIAEYTGLDIYDKKYQNGSGSKSYLLRAFIDREQDPVVGELLENLLEYWRTSKITNGQGINGPEQAIYDDCLMISIRLKQSVVENIDSLKPNTDDKDFRDLSKSIKESIEKNKPELALDRLHTFTVKYVRQLCANHQIFFNF